MQSVRFRIGLAVATLALLAWAAPVQADDFRVALAGQIIVMEPEGGGGTQYVALLEGDGTPTGPVIGVTAFIIRGAAIQEGLVVLVDANEDAVVLLGEGRFTIPPVFEGVARIFGGSGRYANATGELTFSGRDEGGGRFTVTYVGNIDF